MNEKYEKYAKSWWLHTFSIMILSFLYSQSLIAKAYKTLYITDYSNIYHDYEEQSQKLIPALQKRFNLSVDITGRSKNELTETLMDPDFAKGYDLIIYNACLAYTREYILARNLMDQTANGTPTVLLHCAMHNFTGTSSELGIIGKWKLKQDKNNWTKSYPNKVFPVWWEYTGIDTTKHDRAKKLETKIISTHPIIKSFPDNWFSKRDELYLNIRMSNSITPLLSDSEGKHIVAWLNSFGNGEIFATTLGHDNNTLEDDDYIDLVVRGIAYLLGELDESGNIK